MVCYFCGSDQSKVVDKREVRSLGEIRRRRECLKCHRRYTTYERVSVVELYVVKRDGRRELFNQNKLRAGIEKALEKRPGIDKVEDVVSKIENKLRTRGKEEVPTRAIGQMVLSELRRLDKIAYLRFASVYRQFKDLGEFSKELEFLNQKI